MRRTIIFAAAAFVAAAAHAAPETYVIDNAHTFPSFSYSHLGFSTQQSRFDKTSGTIILDREAKRGKADIRIDARSVNTGLPIFNEHIQAPDYFDTKKFPEISFKSDDFRFEGDRLTEVNGTLTIKGITQPVTLKITHFACKPNPIAKKDACGANAVTTVKRSDFNMGKGAPAVSDEVTLNLAVEAFKQ